MLISRELAVKVTLFSNREIATPQLICKNSVNTQKKNFFLFITFNLTMKVEKHEY